MRRATSRRSTAGPRSQTEPLGDQLDAFGGLHHGDTNVVGGGLPVELTGAHQRAGLVGEATGESPGVSVGRREAERRLRAGPPLFA